MVFMLISEMLLDWPFAIYKKFGIEESHGFNNQTLNEWLMD